MKIKTCPASGRKNTDPNVVVQGPWGPAYSQFTIWHRGTSQNPQSKYERVSVLTWEHGGFADEYPNMDDFVSVSHV